MHAADRLTPRTSVPERHRGSDAQDPQEAREAYRAPTRSRPRIPLRRPPRQHGRRARALARAPGAHERDTHALPTPRAGTHGDAAPDHPPHRRLLVRDLHESRVQADSATLQPFVLREVRRASDSCEEAFR